MFAHSPPVKQPFFFFFNWMTRARKSGRLQHIHRGCLLGKHLASLCSVIPPLKSKNLGSPGLTVRRHRCTKLLNLQHFSWVSPAQNTKSLGIKCSPGSRSQLCSRFLLLFPGQGVFTHQLHCRLDSISLEPSFVLHRLFLLGHTCH